MGEPVRRLRALLSQQARGGGHRQAVLHRRRLPPARRQTCRCRDYPNRSTLVDDCLKITPKQLTEIDWLPPSCGYRLVAEGKDLYWWHPLVSGDPDTVHVAGVSVRGRLSGTDNEISDEQLEDHIVRWPIRLPKRAHAPRK